MMVQLNLSKTGSIYAGDYQYEYKNTGRLARTPSRRGFAAMDQQRQKEIASKGGKTAHAKGTAHEFTSEEAAEAGRKGGHAAHAKGTAHEFTSEEAAKAGRKGGRASHSPGMQSPAQGSAGPTGKMLEFWHEHAPKVL
jgi:uncharacterized protein